MSDDTPIGPGEPTSPLPEYETAGPEGPPARSRRVAVIASVAVAVVAVLGGGAYAAYAFLNGGGPQPEDVLPASTVGVVSVDLDPSAGQKISAIRSIRKFPALKDALGLRAEDDLRQFAFDKVLEQGDCGHLTFERDIKPWLGKRAGLGAVDLGEDDPAPVIALQVSDPAAAKKQFAAVLDCSHATDIAFVVGDDYLIASDTADHARTILAKGKQHPLADDATYRKWTGEVGDAGVVNFYLSPKVADYLQALVDEFGSGFEEGLTGGDVTAGASSPRTEDRTVPDSLKDFKGLAGTMRFADGGMELAVAAGGTAKLTDGQKVGGAMADLPKDTAIALGFGVPEDFASALTDQLGTIVGGSSEDFVSQAESETGLDLPDDLQTLLGHSVTLALGADVPTSLDRVEQPEDVPAGLVIRGDAEKIRAVIAKVEDHLGMRLSDIPLVVDDSGDAVVIATSQAYADALLKPGSLGVSDGYRSAVPDAERASGVIYLDFDSAWRDAVADLVRSEEGPDAARTFDENTKPLQSLGISSWTDGGVSHTLVKLATD